VRHWTVATLEHAEREVERLGEEFVQLAQARTGLGHELEREANTMRLRPLGGRAFGRPPAWAKRSLQPDRLELERVEIRVAFNVVDESRVEVRAEIGQVSE
jgi:hypothetical protein